MDWQDGLRTLRRGLGIATRVAAAKLGEFTPTAQPPVRRQAGRFVTLPDSGPNPARLCALAYLPPTQVPSGAALIVLLHGCGQDSASFATEAGWTALADCLGLPLLLPEQSETNNRQRCFQWFDPADIARSHGEAASIAVMTQAAAARFESAPGRIFIAGLSAGGAMAAAMLAAYPDLFSAGAVFAGLPVGSAGSAVQALARMAHGGPSGDRTKLIDQARRGAPAGYAGPWPRLSVWHGEADNVVVPANGVNLAAQWTALHGLPEAATVQHGDRRAWGDAVELWILPELGHTWPIGDGPAQPGRFTAHGPVAAVPEIARFWGLG